MEASHITRKYEGMFLIDNTHATKDWDAVVKHVHEILQKHNAKIHSTEKWGERKLAYEIKGQKRGTYLLIRFDAPTEAITHIKQGCLFSEVILRSMIVSDLGLEVPRFEEVEAAVTKRGVEDTSSINDMEKALTDVELKEIS